MMMLRSPRAVVAAMVLACWPAMALAQPRIRTLTEQEMLDMMQGSSIQASRSSNTETLVNRVKEAFAQGRKFTMISLEDLPDDWTVANLVGVGGGGAWEYVIERTKRQNLPIQTSLPSRASNSALTS